QMTLANKNPAGLIYLLKAKFKMYDMPSKQADVQVDVQVAPVLVVHNHGSDEEWAARAAEQQRNLVLNATSPSQLVLEAPQVASQQLSPPLASADAVPAY